MVVKDDNLTRLVLLLIFKITKVLANRVGCKNHHLTFSEYL